MEIGKTEGDSALQGNTGSLMEQRNVPDSGLNVTTSPSVESDEETRQLRKRKGEISDLDDEEGNVVTTEDRRITLSTEEFVDALLNHKKKEITCQDASCNRTFLSIEEYNDHYMSKHMHKCSVCKKHLPGAHLLELHVLETHDTLFSLMAERKAMYACVAEDCPEKFHTAAERYSHFHKDHKRHELFPAFRHFQNVSENLVGGKSKKGSKSSSKNRNKVPENPTAMELVEDSKEINSNGDDNVESAMDVQTAELKRPTDTQPKKGTKQQGDNKMKNEKTNHTVDIKFGRHATPFRPWHASSGEKVPKCNNSMDLSSITNVLEVTSQISDANEEEKRKENE